MIKDVGEFRLVEIWFSGGPQVIEYSAEMQVALDQASFYISDARDGITTPHERFMLASALFSLYIEAREGLDRGQWLASKLRETLGKAMVKAMQARDVECAIDSCAATVRAALRCVALASGTLHQRQGKRKRKPEVVAILEGARIFRETGSDLPKAESGQQWKIWVSPSRRSTRARDGGKSSPGPHCRISRINANSLTFIKVEDFYKSEGLCVFCAIDRA